MAEWKEYTGSDEQIEEMQNAVNGFILRDNLGLESKRVIFHKKEIHVPENTTHYLICDRHHYSWMIKHWADTGQPVWVRVGAMMREDQFIMYRTYRTTTPDWNIPSAEYSFTPFEDG